MTNERRNELMNAINALTENDSYFFVGIKNPDVEEEGGHETTVAVDASLSTLVARICQLVKNALISEKVSAVKGSRIARLISMKITEACAEASSEVMKTLSPEEQKAQIIELLEYALTSDSDKRENKSEDEASD